MKIIYAYLLRLVVAIVVAVPLMGCGDDGLDRVGISGTVFYEGSPLEGAQVIFRPEFGPSASSETDENGVYHVRSDYGPTSGKCEVRVTKNVVAEEGAWTVNVLPERLALKPKIVEFSSGQNELDIDLDKWEE